jgi:hypothetical protein
MYKSEFKSTDIRQVTGSESGDTATRVRGLRNKVNNLKFAKRRKGGMFGVCAGLLLVLAGVIIFYACRKDASLQSSSIKNHKSMAYYDEVLVNQFMNEPLVNELRSCIESFEMEIYNGILHFRSKDDAEALYDMLIYFSNKWQSLIEENPTLYQAYIESERFPNDPMLFAFEVNNNGHQSGRRVGVYLHQLCN